MKVLGIETACDDTSAAIVEDGRRILSNVIWSQDRLHETHGGIVPEIAARRQVEVLDRVLIQALREANVRFQDIDAIAVNYKHGLVRSIMVGVAAAKALAFSLKVPLVGVHHIEGHIYSAILAKADVQIPHLCLTVAGGHTLLIKVSSLSEYQVLGSTRDDSAGEVFDKIARHLGLGFPGGRLIDQLAERGDPARYVLPRPLMAKEIKDLSFSGLKEAARRRIDEARRRDEEIDIPDFAASLQKAITDVLVVKTIRAAHSAAIKTITVTGGVAANSGLRKALAEEGKRHGLDVVFPPIRLCMDNAAMIAGLGYNKVIAGLRSTLYLDAYPGGPIDGAVG